MMPRIRWIDGKRQVERDRRMVRSSVVVSSTSTSTELRPEYEYDL